jgi:hypothetical protein
MYGYFFYAVLGGAKARRDAGRVVDVDPLPPPLDDNGVSSGAGGQSSSNIAGSNGDNFPDSGSNNNNDIKDDSADDSSGLLDTVPNSELFRARFGRPGSSGAVHVEGNDDRIWFAGKDVYVEIAASRAQLDAMQFEVHGPVRIDTKVRARLWMVLAVGMCGVLLAAAWH